jgi:hypothetical protein
MEILDRAAITAPDTGGHRRRYRGIRLRAGFYGDSGSNWSWRIAAGTLSAWP